MAGHSGLSGADYVYLSALPAIHLLIHTRPEDVPGTSPGMTKEKAQGR
jgi:hypothetical protein